MNPQGPEQVKDLLSKIKEALERATPGPWCIEDPMAPESVWIVQAGKETYEWWPIAVCNLPDEEGHLFTGSEVHANARLIALLSPENVKALIGEVERLQSKHEGLVGALEELRTAAERDYGSPKITLRLAQAILGADIALKDEAPSWRTRAVDAEREVERLREALERVNQTLEVPAAEYVPAIPDAWEIIDAALAQ